MIDAEKRELAACLERERSARVAELADTAGHLRAIAAEREPELEGRAQEERTATILLRLGGKDHRAIAEIDDALARVEAGTYGVCLECGDGIPIARLRAVPTARRCVDCQREEEQAQARVVRKRDGMVVPETGWDEKNVEDGQADDEIERLPASR